MTIRSGCLPLSGPCLSAPTRVAFRWRGAKECRQYCRRDDQRIVGGPREGRCNDASETMARSFRLTWGKLVAAAVAGATSNRTGKKCAALCLQQKAQCTCTPSLL